MYRLAADNFQKLCSLSRQQLLVALSFYVQTHYRLRIGYTYIKAPVVIGNAQSVQMVLLAVSIFFTKLRQYCCGISNLAVDFAAAGIHSNALAYQLAELFAAAAHQLSYQKPRNHAAVAAGEIAEIMMRAHFAAVQNVIITHAFLHKGMAALAAHRHTAVTL